MPLCIDLSNGGVTLVDAADAAAVQALRPYRDPAGYAAFSRWSAGKNHLGRVHSVLMAAPPGSHVDHVNGDKLDNRRENLRVTTPQINQVNRKQLNRNNTSGVRGVRFARPGAARPWTAQMMVNGKHIHLGRFATKEEAVTARRDGERKYFGEQCP